MKKVFFICALAVSALAMASTGTSTTSTDIKITNSDTVPKRDTTKKPIPDSIHVVVNR